MVTEVKMWLNAFIPANVPNYTKSIPKGEYLGKTAIPMPWLARPANMQASSDQGYLTDQRGFDHKPSASVRMQSSVRVLLYPQAMAVVVPLPTTSGTIGVDLVTGKKTGAASADLGKCSSYIHVNHGVMHDILTKAKLTEADEAREIDIYGAGTDPLVNLAAEINYQGRFQIIRNRTSGTLKVQFLGKIDDFPAFEAYASFGGRTVSIFKSAPPKGNTVVNLLGPESRKVRGSVLFRLPR